MEKLVFVVYTSTNYNHTSTDIHSLEYESKNKFIDDIRQAAKIASQKRYNSFTFKSAEFSTFDILQSDFDIYTLDEWFEEFRLC